MAGAASDPHSLLVSIMHTPREVPTVGGVHT
jgi:hypothetical protein